MNFDKETDKTPIFKVAGFKFPRTTLFTQDSIESALSFQPKPRDLFLCSYPQCDSKGLDIIVWKLLYPHTALPPLDEVTNRHIPCLESTRHQESTRRSQRLVKTYLPIHLVPFYKRAKYIYVVRTPWEACASYYRLLCQLDGCTDTFDEFLNSFLDGKCGFGCYFMHVSGWTKRRGDGNVLILCHEHLQNNPRTALFLVASFLGDGFLKQVLLSEDLQNVILNAIGWDYCFSRSREALSAHFRLWKPKCSSEQFRRVMRKATELLKDEAVEHLWINLLKGQRIPIIELL